LPIRIRLLYFGQARDSAGRGEEEYTLPRGSSLQSLMDLVYEKHDRLIGMRKTTKVALNEEIADAGALLHDGDVVALLPPVAGG
jgi:molybdopterin converting factor subunit 1